MTTEIVNELVREDGQTHTELLEALGIIPNTYMEELFWEGLAELIEHDGVIEDDRGACPVYYLNYNTNHGTL